MPVLKTAKRALPTKAKKTTAAPASAPVSSPAKKRAVARTPVSAKITKAKVVAKKTTTPAKEKTAPVPRERDEHGITVGTDQSRVLAQMLQGGTTKHDVVTRCGEMFKGEVTTGGKPKPVSTIVNQLIRTMLPRGYRIESTWRIVPPEPGSGAVGSASEKTAPTKRVVAKKKTTAPVETPTAKPRVLKAVAKRALPTKSNRSKASS